MQSNENLESGCNKPTFFVFFGNIPSLKNTKGIKVIKGRAIIHSSSRVKDWAERNELSFVTFKNKFLKSIENLEKPYNLHMYFIRPSKIRFDYHNVCHLLLDLLTKFEWIEDDDSTTIVPVFEGYEISKTKASVIIWTSPRSANNYQQKNIDQFLKSVFPT
jgi:hypothetical protein